mgnify:FL=1
MPLGSAALSDPYIPDGMPVLDKPLVLSQPVLASWSLTGPVGWAGRPTPVTATVIDSDGLDAPTAAYRMSTDAGVNWTAWELVDSYSAPISTTVRMTVTIAGFIDSATENRVQFLIKDALDNVEVSPAYMVQVDGTAPTAPLDLAVDPAGWTPTNAFTLTWSNPADVSGITRAYYKLGDAPGHGGDFDGWLDGAGIARLTGIASPAAGAVPCYVWLQDVVGNVDHTHVATATLRYSGGIAPPRPFALQITPADWTNICVYTATWANPTVPAGIEAAWYKWGAPPTHAEDGTRAAGSNIQRLEGLSPAYQSEWDLHVWLEDGAGMKDHNNRRTVQARCDTDPPQTSHVLTPPLPTSGWYTDDVSVSLMAYDSLSGVGAILWRRGGDLWNAGDAFVISGAGEHVYYYKAIDLARNEDVEHEITVRIDPNPPQSTLLVVPPRPASGWYSNTVTITLSATDDLSGWPGETWYRLNGDPWQKSEDPAGATILLQNAGAYELSYYSSDRAGNAESPRMAPEPFRIDRGRPRITATLSITGTYVRPPVTILLTASDEEPGLTTSGIEAIEYRRLSGPGQGETPWTRGSQIVLDGSQGDGTYVYAYRARDRAGNSSDIGQITINLDGTPPGQPRNITASPTTWVNTDGRFGLTWENPQDFSGIACVHYQIDVDPAVTLLPDHPRWCRGDIRALDNIAVGSEGQHTIYVWLEDGAGNATPYERAMLPNAFKLDTSPPSLDAPGIRGPLGCNGKHYTGPVTMTLRAHDNLSGIASFKYRDNGGSWVVLPVTAPDFVLSAQGRHIVEYTATDVAGNTQSVAASRTIYIDSLPPAAPIRLGASPAAWTRNNSFGVFWTNPTDYAGIKAAHYKIGSAPTSPEDGQRIEGIDIARIDGLSVPAEGETLIYVWLEDAACNADYTTAQSAVLKYDPTAPTTNLIVDGTPGNNGYYVSPITVRFEAADASSGVAQTYYRINDAQTWQAWNGQPITLPHSGEYRLSYYSTDVAGNQELPQQSPRLKVDLLPPTCELSVANAYVPSTSVEVEVRWGGSDALSGVAKYTVQYRRGTSGPWQTWLAETTQTSGIFTGIPVGGYYQFRVRAWDHAGLASEWSEIDCNDSVYREGLLNPSFELGGFGAWVPEGELGARVVYTGSHTGGQGWMARLSEERPYYEVPINAYAAVSQQITLPEMQGRGLTLSFWYRLQSYDMAWAVDVADGQEKWFDPFFVHIRDARGGELATFLPDGNLMDPDLWEEFKLWDPGWLYYSVDLTPWAGQTIQIEFRVWNQVDEQWATWVYIDDVALHLPGPQCGQFVPLVARNANAPALLGAAESHVAPAAEQVPSEERVKVSEWDPSKPKPKSRRPLGPAASGF